MRKTVSAIAVLALCAAAFAAPQQGQMKGSAVNPVRGVEPSSNMLCNELQFSVTSSRESATGLGAGRATASGITCIRAVDQIAMQYLQDAMTIRRLPTLTISWQNQIVAMMTNAEVASAQFTTLQGQEVAEITFNFQKIEITHTASNTKFVIQ